MTSPGDQYQPSTPFRLPPGQQEAPRADRVSWGRIMQEAIVEQRNRNVARQRQDPRIAGLIDRIMGRTSREEQRDPCGDLTNSERDNLKAARTRLNRSLINGHMSPGQALDDQGNVSDGGDPT